MPWLQRNIYGLMLSLSAGMLSLTGCSKGVSDKQWASTVPGVYHGLQRNFREVLDVKPDGTFHHEVFIDNSSVHSEAGTWSYDVRSGMLQVKPFTSFYDRQSRRMTTGVSAVADMLGVLRYGKAASKITQSIEGDYNLTKITLP
jgi:hypothetical protein